MEGRRQTSTFVCADHPTHRGGSAGEIGSRLGRPSVSALSGRGDLDCQVRGEWDGAILFRGRDQRVALAGAEGRRQEAGPSRQRETCTRYRRQSRRPGYAPRHNRAKVRRCGVRSVSPVSRCRPCGPTALPRAHSGTRRHPASKHLLYPRTMNEQATALLKVVSHLAAAGTPARPA